MCPNESINILKWYPFKKDDRVLIIKDDNFPADDEKYDIIILLGVTHTLTLQKVLLKLSANLAENGRFLIAVDNKFGIRFFAGNPENILGQKFQSLIGYSNEPQKIETYTRSSLKKQLTDLGFNTRFYYPLPDYRIPNVIFTDEQLPEYNSIDKYYPYCSEKSDILFNEIDVFREILKSEQSAFAFFANSFFVEAAKDMPDKTYKYISFNNLRKEKFQLITKIADTFVEKQVVSDAAREHYENIKSNIKTLESMGLRTVDYIDGDIIKSRYVEQKYLLNNVLTEKLEQNKLGEFYTILNSFIDCLNTGAYNETDYEKTVFASYEIETENEDIIASMHFLKNGLWDMTFKNCFFKDGEFLFFDQEWNEPAIPAEFILYRSIIYTISLRRYININSLLEKYNLIPYLEIFKKMDDKLQESIKSDEAWRFYNQDKFIDIDATKQEVINLNIRSTAQQTENDNLKAAQQNLINENNNLKQTIAKQQAELEKRLITRISSFIKKLKQGK